MKYVKYGNILRLQKFFDVKCVRKTSVSLVKYAPLSTQVCIKPGNALSQTLELKYAVYRREVRLRTSRRTYAYYETHLIPLKAYANLLTKLLLTIVKIQRQVSIDIF